MTTASGLARIVGELGTNSWIFQPYYGTGYITNILLSGAWTNDGSKITWNGAAPEAVNTDSNTRVVNALTIRIGADASDNKIFAHIPHANVTLNQNDTILYSAVEVNFSTEENINQN